MRALIGLILRDYLKFNVSDMLTQAVDILATRENGRNNRTESPTINLLAQVEELENNNVFLKLSPREQAFLMSSPWAATLPNRIASMLKYSVTDDLRMGAPSAEVDYYRQNFHNNVSSMGHIYDVFGNLPIPKYEIPQGSLAFDVTISKQTYEGDLSELADSFKEFDRFLASVVNGLNPGQPKPKVVFLDNGSAIATLVATAVVVQSCFSMYRAVVLAVEAAAEYYKAKRTLDAIPGNFDRDAINASIESSVETALKSQLAAVEKELGRPFDHETRSSLEMTSTVLMENIRKGCKITIKTAIDRNNFEPNESGDGGPSSGDGGDGGILRKLIAESQLLEVAVDAIAALAKPIAQIPGPSDGGG